MAGFNFITVRLGKDSIPDIKQIIIFNIAIDKLWATFNIKACTNVAVVLNAGNVNPCTAEVVPGASLSLALKSQIVVAAIHKLYLIILMIYYIVDYILIIL